MPLGEYNEDALQSAALELSSTPTNSSENNGIFSSRFGHENTSCDSIDEDILEDHEETSENDVVKVDISFQQRQEQAKTTRRKKKKTDSSLVATTFKELYQLTGRI